METSANHADNTGYRNAAHTPNAEPAEPVEGSRERADQCWDGEDPGVQYRTELVVAQRR